MAYQINKTDGTVVATVADGQIDDVSTDITLIGKNYSGFGEAINENFVKLLENFSGSNTPEHPIRGQIWFDTTELKLKVYSGTAFIPVSSATISNSQPSTLGVGDLWFNDVARQLYFFDGSETILLGPDYSQTQGISGFKVESILDSLNQTRVITKLFTNSVLLGIFSNSSFTPKNAIEGFTGSIQPGFNSGTLSGIKFDVTVTNSEQLDGKDAGEYAVTTTDNVFQGLITVTDGIEFGDSNQGKLFVEAGDVKLTNAASNAQLILNVRKGIVQEDAVVVDADTRNVSFYTGFTDSSVDIAGDLGVGGNVTINGTLTINDGDINVRRETELQIEDKYLVMAQTGDSGSNSDEFANGGGIVLKGTSDHVLLWSSTGFAASPEYPELAPQAWTSSDHINLASGKAFKINGVTVIDGSSLGPGITSIPGVTSFGTQNVVNIGTTPPTADFKLEVDSGSSNPRITTLLSNSDLELAPDGSGNVVLIGSPKITGLADPTDAQDAATKEYVDDTVETRSLAFSMDLSDGKPNSYIAGTVLATLAPVAEYRNGTIARILCTQLSNSTTSLDIDPLLSQTTAEFNTPSGTAFAVTDVASAIATVSAPSITTTRVVKTFQLLAGAWSFISETALP